MLLIRTLEGNDMDFFLTYSCTVVLILLLIWEDFLLKFDYLSLYGVMAAVS